MSSTIFTIGNIEIQWYSFLLLIAFSFGFIFVLKNRNKLNLTKTQVTDMLFYLVIICILGARIYYVLFNLDYYLAYPADILKIWEGGLAIHGGIIAGLIYIVLYCKKKNINPLLLTDIMVPALALGQAIGRWGNFFNKEAYGSITSYEFLQSIHLPNFIIEGMYIGRNYYHPTFLYESIWCFIIFIVLIILMRFKKNRTGVLTSIYLIMYGLERVFIESLRQDSLMILNFKVAQIVSIVMIMFGIVILIKSRRKYDK